MKNRERLRSLLWVYNFVGALTLVLWIYVSKQWTISNHLLGAKIVLAANDKANIPKPLPLLKKWQGKHSTFPNLPGRNFL